MTVTTTIIFRRDHFIRVGIETHISTTGLSTVKRSWQNDIPKNKNDPALFDLKT